MVVAVASLTDSAVSIQDRAHIETEGRTGKIMDALLDQERPGK